MLGRTEQSAKMLSSDKQEFKGLKDWENENRDNQMQTFRYFTHSTSKESMEKIRENGVLKPLLTPGKWKAPLARSDAPKGSWFSMTLYKDNLPTFSPYGDRRVRKEAGEMIKEIAWNPRLFLETVVFRITEMAGKKTRTARLILVNRGDDTTIKWCKQYCNTELDLFNNPFMKIVNGNKEYDQNTPIALETHKNVESVPDTWVVLLVPYDVNIAECEWDNFKNPIPGN